MKFRTDLQKRFVNCWSVKHWLMIFKGRLLIKNAWQVKACPVNALHGIQVLRLIFIYACFACLSGCRQASFIAIGKKANILSQGLVQNLVATYCNSRQRLFSSFSFSAFEVSVLFQLASEHSFISWTGVNSALLPCTRINLEHEDFFKCLISPREQQNLASNQLCFSL